MNTEQELKTIAETIIQFLKTKQPDLIIQRYDAYSTNSIYLKFDYGVAYSLRISDHKGKQKLKYRYNVQLDYSNATMVYDHQRFYYPSNKLTELAEKILYERSMRIQLYGWEQYKIYMEINKEKGRQKKNGFWAQAKIV